jgi:hypothetical protein
MDSLRDEAVRRWLQIQLGVTTPKKVIDWVDGAIAGMDRPPSALIELSTADVNRTETVISALTELGNGADYWAAFRGALGDAHTFLTTNPGDGERVAQRIYGIVARSARDVPGEFNGLYRWEDAFYLAREGVYGSEQQVLEQLMDELSSFKITQNQHLSTTEQAKSGDREAGSQR